MYLSVIDLKSGNICEKSYLKNIWEGGFQPPWPPPLGKASLMVGVKNKNNKQIIWEYPLFYVVTEYNSACNST